MDNDLLVSTEYDFRDIPGSESWIRLSEISEGDSTDRKFYIKNCNRERFFLRVADRTTYDRKKDEYELLSAIHEFGVPVPDPVGFGLCNRGKSLYLQTRWIYGNQGTKALQGLPKYQQYALGTDAGFYLKLIHDCEIPPRRNTWEARQLSRLEKNLGALAQHRRATALEMKIIGILENGRHILANRPQTLLHGDFNTDNVVLSYENSFRLIDFDNWQYGDPMADLSNVLTRIQSVSVPYAIGVIDCYFNFQITDDDLMMMQLYAIMDLIERLNASKWRTADEYRASREALQSLMHDFQNGRSICPVWYKRMRTTGKRCEISRMTPDL
jgi:aminoglycoside phosphotransferase (APT) family kinase protein